MVAAVPHLGRIDVVPENAWTPVARGDMSGAGFGSAVARALSRQPGMRASAVMAELTRLAAERAAAPMAAE